MSVVLCFQTVYFKQTSESVALLAVSPRCWRYQHAVGGINTLLAVSPRCWRHHHAAGGITTLLAVSPRCWRYHHASGGITTLLAVSPRCWRYHHAAGGIATLFSQQLHSHGHSVTVTRFLNLSFRSDTNLAVRHESWTLLSCLSSTPPEVL